MTHSARLKTLTLQIGETATAESRKVPSQADTLMTHSTGAVGLICSIHLSSQATVCKGWQGVVPIGATHA